MTQTKHERKMKRQNGTTAAEVECLNDTFIGTSFILYIRDIATTIHRNTPCTKLLVEFEHIFIACHGEKAGRTTHFCFIDSTIEYDDVLVLVRSMEFYVKAREYGSAVIRPSATVRTRVFASIQVDTLQPLRSQLFLQFRPFDSVLI